MKSDHKMCQHLKKGFGFFIVLLVGSFALGYILILILRLVNSFYEELLAAFFIGAFSFITSKKLGLILTGALAWVCGV